VLNQPSALIYENCHEEITVPGFKLAWAKTSHEAHLTAYPKYQIMYLHNLSEILLPLPSLGKRNVTSRTYACEEAKSKQILKSRRVVHENADNLILNS